MRPLLILDLDETLIFGTTWELDYRCDFEVGLFYVYERPMLHPFLDAVSDVYDLAVWSSGSCDYVQEIADVIGSEHEFDWKFVWSRSRCVVGKNLETQESFFIKDLKKTKRFGYPLERTLIVDDTPTKCIRNYGNAIYPSCFEGDWRDRELEPLAAYLLGISDKPNFRSFEKRSWKSIQAGEGISPGFIGGSFASIESCQRDG